MSDELRRVDVDKFIFLKLQEEIGLIDVEIEKTSISKTEIEDSLEVHRKDIDDLEKKLYSKENRVSKLKENKQLLKTRFEEIKKKIKI